MEAAEASLTDAYRRRFGEPSRQEIHVLRRQRGDVLLLPEDFEGTDHLLPMDRTNLALAHARARVQRAVPAGQDPDDQTGIWDLCAPPEALHPA